MTDISWSSDLALYLESYWMYEHPYFRIMNQFDLKIDVGHCDLCGPVILCYILKTI